MDSNLSKNFRLGLPPQIKTARNSLIELVLLIVVCILFGWFIILPKNAEVSAKKADLEKIKTQESQMADKLAKLKTMVQTLDSNPDKVAKLDQALPLDGKPIHLKVLIEALAASSGVVIGDVNVASTKADAVVSGDKALLANPYAVTRSLQKLTGSIYAIGSFPQLKAFLEKLEGSGRLLDINDLSLDSAPDGSLNLKVSITSYALLP